MRKLFSFLTGCGFILLLMGVGTVWAQHEDLMEFDPSIFSELAEEAEEMTIEGQLVSLRCFVGKGTQGATDHQCSAACTKRGTPLGVVDAGGKAYIMLVSPAAYADYMAKTVRITGTVKSMMVVPTKMEVKEGDNWKEVKLSQEMM